MRPADTLILPPRTIQSYSGQPVADTVPPSDHIASFLSISRASCLEHKVLFYVTWQYGQLIPVSEAVLFQLRFFSFSFSHSYDLSVTVSVTVM